MDVHDGDTAAFARKRGSMTAEERRVIFASSLGTVFELARSLRYSRRSSFLAGD